MIHPDTTLQPMRPEIGMGVVATAPIPRGTITWVLDPLDQVLSPECVAALPSVCGADLERYTWQDEVGNLVLCWDITRFVNHSCEPSCLTTSFGFEIAIRDIAPGEELTNDYANLGLQPEERFRCLCDAPSCRGLVEAADAARLVGSWVEQVGAALKQAARVQQPLWQLLDGEVREALRAARLQSRPTGLRRAGGIARPARLP